MAEVSSTGSSHGKHHARRQPKVMPRVDMTPMVDLGFLLITFFILTMQLQKHKALQLDKRLAIDQTPVPECCVLNILIDSADKVYTYEGEDMKNIKPTSFNHSNGIEQVVIEKRKRVMAECSKTKDGKPRELICLIKLLPNTRYQNMVDIIDDMEVLHPVIYSLQEPLPEEMAALQLKEKELLAMK